MSFHQDVLEGINAFTAMRQATKESPYEQYYRYKLDKEKQEQKDMEDYIKKREAQTQGAQTGAGGQPGQATASAPPVTATTINMPNATPGATTAAPVPSTSGGTGINPGADYLQRGGEVGHFQSGGPLGSEFGDDPRQQPVTPQVLNARRRALDTAPTRDDLLSMPPEPTPTPRDLLILRDKAIENLGVINNALKRTVPPDQSSTTRSLPPGGLETPPPSAPPPQGSSEQAANVPQTQPQQPPVPPPLPRSNQPPAVPPSITADPSMSVVGPPPAALQTPGPGPSTQPPAPAPAPARPGSPPSAAGAGQPPPPQGSLWDPNRTTAFDPTKDFADPGNVGVVQPGGGVNQQQFANVEQARGQFDNAVNGAVHFASWLTNRGEDHAHAPVSAMALHAGVGAMPAPVAQGVYKAWSDGGRLDPAAALTRYMVFKYEWLSANGKTAQANQMAFEVLQRLNMEASMHGGQAIDFMKEGNMQGAVTAIQQGHSFTPDGKELKVSRDGKQAVMVDQFTGQPSSQVFQITPQFILANAMHLQNGNAMWNTLAMRARSIGGGKADKDAEGRALRNLRTIEQIRILRAKGAGKGGGGGAASPTVERLNELRFGKPNTPAAVNQGSSEDPAYTSALSAGEGGGETGPEE